MNHDDSSAADLRERVQSLIADELARLKAREREVLRELKITPLMSEQRRATLRLEIISNLNRQRQLQQDWETAWHEST